MGGTARFGQAIWNEGQEHQVEINDMGIRVGLNSTHMDAHGVYAGGHDWDNANAAMHEDGRIKGIYGNIEKDFAVGGKLDAGELTVQGNGEVKGDFTVGGDTHIGGNTTINKDLTVEGDTLIKKDLHVSGGTYIGGDTNIGGNVNIDKDLHVDGNTYTAGDHYVQNNLHVDGNSYFSGDVVIEKDLVVKGDTAIQGTLVADNVVVAGRDMMGEINRLDSRVDVAGANAAAMASLAPVPTDEDQKWNFAASVGNYRGATAGAVGLFYKPTDNVMLNMRSSFGNSETMFGAGVGVALTKGGSNGLTKQALTKKVVSLEQDKAALTDKVGKLEKDNADMKRAMLLMMDKIEKISATKK